MMRKLFISKANNMNSKHQILSVATEKKKTYQNRNIPESLSVPNRTRLLARHKQFMQMSSGDSLKAKQQQPGRRVQ